MNAQAEVAVQILASLREQCTDGAMKGTTATVESTFDCRLVAIAAN